MKRFMYCTVYISNRKFGIFFSFWYFARYFFYSDTQGLCILSNIPHNFYLMNFSAVVQLYVISLLISLLNSIHTLRVSSLPLPLLAYSHISNNCICHYPHVYIVPKYSVQWRYEVYKFTVSPVTKRQMLVFIISEPLTISEPIFDDLWMNRYYIYLYVLTGSCVCDDNNPYGTNWNWTDKCSLNFKNKI